MSDYVYDLIHLRLSLQRALIGQVSSKIRGVVLEFDGVVATIHTYVDGQVDDADFDDMNAMHGEVLSDFPDEAIYLQIHEIEFPKPLPRIGSSSQTWIYMRHE